MPSRKKKAPEQSTDEAMRRLFPKKVRDELRRLAHEKDDEADNEEENDSSQDESNR